MTAAPLPERTANGGQPPLPTRLVAALAILKHTYDLSDEALCKRWLVNPYSPAVLRRRTLSSHNTFDRSSLTRWRQRMGEENLTGRCRRAFP